MRLCAKSRQRTLRFVVRAMALVASAVVPTLQAAAQDAVHPATTPHDTTSAAAACRGVEMPLADCLKIVAEVARFVDGASTNDQIAEAICGPANAPGSACRDSVARMKDWSAATFGSSTPPRRTQPPAKGRQWSAPSVDAYRRE